MEGRLASTFIQPKDVLKVPEIVVGNTALSPDKLYTLVQNRGVFSLIEHEKLMSTDILEGTSMDGDIDVSSGNLFNITCTKAMSVKFSGVTGATFILIRMYNGGTFPITWPAEMKWPGGTIPALTRNGMDEIGIMFFPDGSITGRITTGIKS